ncbi:hydrolase [Methylobacterium radiotolerans]|nr:hydrolase [Methylobacterium radiotolerans]KTS50996.1 hydrolase [Methylobacterium radiotolerans]
MHLPETAARIVSCDVFDTLLHRDHRSERCRFHDIATVASRALAAEHGTAPRPGAIYAARLQVQRAAYRALDLANPSGDVRFADMLAAMTRVLSLDDRAADILYRAEITVELAQLRANTPLMTWLKRRAQAGDRIIAVSDTYHRGATIAHLLDTLAPGHPVAHIYTSADHDATKRTRALFDVVLRTEKVAPAEILHLGDDTLADVTMAAAAGLRTAQLLRPRHVVLRRRLDAVRARAMHRHWIGAARNGTRRTGP